MNKTLEDVKSAVGQAFELVKLLIEAIFDNGGNIKDLSRFLSAESQSLRDAVARLIIGGIWDMVGVKNQVCVNWGTPFTDLAKIVGKNVIVDPSMLHNYYVGATSKTDLYNPDQSVFVSTDDQLNVGVTNYFYTLVQAPEDLFPDQFEKWLLENRERLATDRELLYYAANHVSWRCRIVALGNRTEDGCFPFLRKMENGHDLVFSFIRLNLFQAEKPVFGPNTFILMRCTD